MLRSDSWGRRDTVYRDLGVASVNVQIIKSDVERSARSIKSAADQVAKIDFGSPVGEDRRRDGGSKPTLKTHDQPLPRRPSTT